MVAKNLTPKQVYKLLIFTVLINNTIVMKKIKVYGAIGIGVITVSILMMAITNSPWFMLGIIAGGAVTGANSAKLTDIHRKL